MCETLRTAVRKIASVDATVLMTRHAIFITTVPGTDTLSEKADN